MKLLFDDNLSWRLEKFFAEDFPGSIHIRRINSLPKPAKDTEIWNFALKNDYILVTNDDDFYKLAMLRVKSPKVVIIRTGNRRTSDISDLLKNKKNELQKFCDNKEYTLFEIR